jgi:hypothetical protein
MKFSENGGWRSEVRGWKLRMEDEKLRILSLVAYRRFDLFFGGKKTINS